MLGPQTLIMAPEVGPELIELDCMVCNKVYMDTEPQRCCNGWQCGCMGQPIDPVVCSQECYDKIINNERL